jgi:Fe-S cluster biogenesis protein NfuA
VDDLEARVRDALKQISPALSVDGGGVELDRIEGDAVFLRLTGACIGCPGADITLQYGIESALTSIQRPWRGRGRPVTASSSVCSAVRVTLGL